jgi:hypothetical protein
VGTECDMPVVECDGFILQPWGSSEELLSARRCSCAHVLVANCTWLPSGYAVRVVISFNVGGLCCFSLTEGDDCIVHSLRLFLLGWRPAFCRCKTERTSAHGRAV